MSPDPSPSFNSDQQGQLSSGYSPLADPPSSITVTEDEPFAETTPLLPGASPRAIGDEIDLRSVFWEELKYLTKTSLQVFMFVRDLLVHILACKPDRHVERIYLGSL
jgi:hypothetical protein